MGREQTIRERERERKTERERKRERKTERERLLLRKGCGVLIKMAIRLIPRISYRQYSLGATPFHQASKLPIYTTKP